MSTDRNRKLKSSISAPEKAKGRAALRLCRSSRKLKIAVLTAAMIIGSSVSAFAAADQMTLTFTGDLMCKYEMQYAAYDGSDYDFRDTFRYAKKIFDKSDFTVGNLETNISESSLLTRDLHYLQGRPYLNAPEEFLDALKYAGFDGLIMANNHVCDCGATGIKETLKAVEKAGFRHTGLYDSSKDKHYFLFSKNGIKVAVLAYGNYFNEKEHFLTDKQQDTMLARIDEEQIKKDVKAAKKAGAEFIIAYVHAGDEYTDEIADRQKAYAQLLADCGADYIIGSHPHVLQETGTVVTESGREVPVVYSMGNFTGELSNRDTRETAILRLKLTKNSKGKVKVKSEKFIPCYFSEYWNEDKFVLIPEGYETTDPEHTKEVKKHFENSRKRLKID